MTIDALKGMLIDLMEKGNAHYHIDIEDGDGHLWVLRSIRRRNGRLVLSTFSDTEVIARGLEDEEKS